MLELEIAPRAAQEAPKRPQERQEAAKRRQDSAERRQESAKRRQDAPKSDLGAIWVRFWTPRGRQNLDFRCNCRRKSRFSCFSKGVGKRDPTSSQRRLPGDKNGSQERPGSGQERPKRRQDSARSGQARPRSAPRAAQEANKRSKKGSSYRFRSWGGHFGAIFKSFFFVCSDPLSPPAREAFQATPQLKTLSGGAERAREA